MIKRELSRKKILLVLLITGLLIAVILFRPVTHLLMVKSHDTEVLPALEKGYADDVSRLNKTPVHALIAISAHPDTALRQLIETIAYARKHKLPVSIAGAKHSMGGHTIAQEGIVINMLPFKKLSLDTLRGILTVGAGALWSDVIPYLNQFGRAVSIMQSDNAFSVGGSISVNCHGWQHNKPPIASSVVSFQLLKADGTIVTCSRQENKELFSLVLGGYGLFGIILEVELQTVANETYIYQRILIDSEQYIDNYKQFIDQNRKVRMVYGRLNVNKEDFLKEATLNYFEFEKQAKAKDPLSDPGFTSLKRYIFIGSKKDKYGKKLRWEAEQLLSKTMIGSKHSRNQIMNESPAIYLNRSASHTDILHEYFIPRRNFNRFISELQTIIPKHKADLLNVTIRNVYPDQDAFLSYAHKEMFAFVMFFNQAKTQQAEQDMLELTQALIDASNKLEGNYYLPYRLHASPTQFRKSYPMAKDFFNKKLTYDPEEIFQNKFYQQYITQGIVKPTANFIKAD